MKKFLRVVPSKFVQIASTIELFGDMEHMTIKKVDGRLKAREEIVRGQLKNSKGHLQHTHEE